MAGFFVPPPLRVELGTRALGSVRCLFGGCRAHRPGREAVTQALGFVATGWEQSRGIKWAVGRALEKQR